jgi:hypothetical protein
VRESQGEIRIWPAALALGLAVLVVVSAIAVVVSRNRRAEEDGPLERLPILLAVPQRNDLVRVLTEEGGCRHAVSAMADVRADVVVLRVFGRNPAGGCTAEIKVRCHEIALPVALGRRRVLPTRAPDRLAPPAAEAVIATGPCPRLPLATAEAA